MKYKLSAFIAFLLALPVLAGAHENYVLPQDQIDAGMKDYSLNVLTALKDPTNLSMSIAIGLSIALAVILYYFFERSRFGIAFDRTLKKAEPFGHVILRIALAASLFASAKTFAYLGPEISIFSLPFGSLIHYLLYPLGILLLFGLFSEFVGYLSLIIIIAATFVYRDYILTYFNYFGEFLALMFFGSRIFSFDRFLFGAESNKRFKQIEIFLIRVTYGISIIYPAVMIKLLHPGIIVQIVNQYHLNNYHWLFPHDPLLIALGGGLTQVVLGIFLIIGFETRLSTFITFVLMAMSVIFFKEAVWPHYILLALALYLMINNGGAISVDHKIMKKAQAKLS